jgi:hypothetical protein
VAITDYTTLKAAVLDWCARPELTAQVADFIAFAELEFAPLLRQKVLRAPLTLDSDAVTLPADLAELRSVRLDTDTYNHVIKIGTPEDLADFRPNGTATSVPLRGAVVNGVLLLAPPPSSAFVGEIIYFQALVPLSDANPTNNTLVSAPNVYLFSALAQAELYLEHDERSQVWAAKASGAIDNLNNKREREQLGAAGTPRLPVTFG